MSEWDGTRVRGLFQDNIRGMMDVMERMNWDQQNEVQILVARIRDLVLASQNSHNPAGLRGPLNRLVNYMAIHATVFITHPEKYEVFLFGRMFSIAAMTVVDQHEQLETPNAVESDLGDSTGKFILPNGPTPSPIQQHPTGDLELANVEVKPIRMSAKRKLVFTEQEMPTSPKRTLIIPKKERSGVAVVDESVAESSRIHPDEVEVEVVDDNIEKKKCDHCNLKVRSSEMEQLIHVWKKHKNLVYKFIRPELVCTIDYCDYVGSSVRARKIHVGRIHGTEPLIQGEVVPELKASKCRYCDAEIDSIVSLKQHVLQCTQRDERPMLGCSSCPNQSFHFIYDFTAHLKKFGGVTHGNPTLLSNE